MNYLTEQSLIHFCRTHIHPNDEVEYNKKIKNISTHLNFRPDIHYPKLKLVVEFDGYLHYTKSETCLLDSLKDDILKDNGYRVIRIPYFVQLSKESILYYFGVEIDYEQTYPHGFISNSVIFPADFCSLGISRYERELNSLPYEVRSDIESSLESAARYSRFGRKQIFY